jgi:type I restriction enzyme M protein
MAKETGQEEQLPKGYRWGDLEKKDGLQQLDFYRGLLIHLGSHGSPRVQAIFAGATRPPSASRATCASSSTRSTASTGTARRPRASGTSTRGCSRRTRRRRSPARANTSRPRPLIECMVDLREAPARRAGARPGLGHRRLPDRGGPLHPRRDRRPVHPERDSCSCSSARGLLRHGAGRRHAPPRADERPAPRHRGRHPPGGRARPAGAQLPKADVILTNPPFGTKKGGGAATRDDFTYPTSNKQLASCSTSTAASSPAAARPWCSPTTCCSRTASARDPHRPDGQVRPAHDPAAAHRASSTPRA